MMVVMMMMMRTKMTMNSILMGGRVSVNRAAHAIGADVRNDTGGWSGVKGGDIQIQQPSQHVLERSSVFTTADGFELHFAGNLGSRSRGDSAALSSRRLVAAV